jgi:hypothetical protein
VFNGGANDLDGFAAFCGRSAEARYPCTLPSADTSSLFQVACVHGPTLK